MAGAVGSRTIQVGLLGQDAGGGAFKEEGELRDWGGSKVAGTAAVMVVIDDCHGGQAQQRLDRNKIDLPEVGSGGSGWPAQDRAPLGPGLDRCDV